MDTKFQSDVEKNVVPPAMVGMSGLGGKQCGAWAGVQSALSPFRHATVSRLLTYSSVAGPPALYYLTAAVDSSSIVAFDAGVGDAETNPNLAHLTSPDSLLKYTDTNTEREGELAGDETEFKAYAVECYLGHPYILSGGKRRTTTKADSFLEGLKAAVLEWTKISILVGNANAEYQLGNPMLWGASFGLQGSGQGAKSGNSPIGFYRTLLQPVRGGSFRSKDKLALKWANEREFSIESSSDVTANAYIDLKVILTGIPVQ